MTNNLALLVLLVPALCAAAGLELPYVDDSMAGKPRVGTLPSRHKTIDGIQLSRTSLSEVQKKFGAAEVFRASESDGANKGVCYLAENREDGTAVIFESGAMGGWEIITSVTVAPLHFLSARAQARCAKTGKVSRRLRTGGGLRLNLSGTKLPNLGLAAGTVDPRGITQFRFLKDQLVSRPSQSGDTTTTAVKQVSSGALVALSDNKIQWFQVYWVESY